MKEMADLFIHRFKRRMLASCLTTLIGGPVMCCCLFGLFTYVLPAIDKANPAASQDILVQGGLGVLIILLVMALAGIAFYLNRRGLNILGIFRGEGLQLAGLPRFRQISILVLLFGLPVCLLVVGVIAYLIFTRS
jgi:hypothetical protein